MSKRRIVLVTGLSGAGKSSILRTLEDLGYEAVDNPPVKLLPGLVLRGERPLAIGIDARSSGFEAGRLLAAFDKLRANPHFQPELVFATADETSLLRRYTETRRRHPLAPSGPVAAGIAAEIALTDRLRAAADLIIDSSNLPPNALRALVEEHFADTPPGLSVTLLSFAFPGGLPREADMVFDARFLRNPHYDPGLQKLTGLDDAVHAYIEADPDFFPFLNKMKELIDLVLPRFVQEGKKYATIAIGCTGGRHRSVALTHDLAEYLNEKGWQLSVMHRELAVGQGQKMHRRLTDRTASTTSAPKS
jgi:UPF0042 nucleotide-binding protein